MDVVILVLYICPVVHALVKINSSRAVGGGKVSGWTGAGFAVAGCWLGADPVHQMTEDIYVVNKDSLPS